MIFVGIDDTDTRETPGTNKLAMHLAGLLKRDYETPWIVRHQCLQDPRVPCTNMNGCVSLALEPRGACDRDALISWLRQTIIDWCPAGSDPGLCVTEKVPPAISEWGRRVQREFVHQSQAIELGKQAGVYLEPLGGTGDGVIGALAAVGLLATWNSGRVVYRGNLGENMMDITGCHEAEALYARGVDEILCLADSNRIETGTIDVGKRLRPNLRHGRMVLYVSKSTDTSVPANWTAERVVA